MMQERTREADVPYSGSFELTPLCNLDCKMCYVHLQDPSVRHRMLSGEQWISLIQQAIDEGMMEALLTGGEAMTHPAFWDIYMYLINHGIVTQVKTNGLLLNEEAIKRFQQYPPFKLDISLYGCDSESYVAVTGVDAYEQVVSHIRMAVEAGLTIQIMVTPNSYMSPWTERVMALAGSFGVSVMVNGSLIDPHENTGRKKADFIIFGNDASGNEVFEINISTKSRGCLVCSKHYREGRIIMAGDISTHIFERLLIKMYALATAGNDTLVLHAVVVSCEGNGYIFLGLCGAGKSTHARLWLKHIEGTELVNDDHPVVRNGVVYGSPWSPITPCYRNVSYPISGFVRLSPAPYNKIHRISGIEAYLNLYCSDMGRIGDSSIAKNIDECLHQTKDKLAQTIPMWQPSVKQFESIYCDHGCNYNCIVPLCAVLQVHRKCHHANSN